MLDRDEDMIYSGAFVLFAMQFFPYSNTAGQRHPFLGKYKVGFKKDGTVVALDVHLFANAGYSADLSLAVVERGVSHSDNVYFIPNIRARGRACKTNIHSNTAYVL
jgi:xanthine dehydrogenase/oxidase